MTDFEAQTLAVQQVHGFLLTVLLRSHLADMPPDRVDATITALLRAFSTLELPANARTDAATLRAISERHARAQDILRQMLAFARPHPDAGA